MKTYETPELEIVRFQIEDIVRCSESFYYEDTNPNVDGQIEEP